jgi:WD40 repeat protein
LKSPGRRESEIRVWDAATGETVLTRTFAHSLIDAVTYNGNGTLLAATVGAFAGEVGDAEVIKVLDAASGQERHSFAGHRDRIGQLAFSPDGRRLASLAVFPTHLAEVKLWDLAGGREVLTLKPTRVDRAGSNAISNSGFAFSSDGHRLFYLPGGSRRDADVQVWDATPMPDERAEGSGPSSPPRS